MNCPACGYANPAHAKFCLECGARLVVSCARCGAELPPTAKFCLECGQPAASATAPRFAAPEAYTPQHLAQRILLSRGALEGERKQVTVLFADLKGSMELLADRDPEEARAVLDPVIERMMDAVHRYEGTVNQVMGDGIMALFGAPIAHEDHAVRACYAALSMQEAVKRYAAEIRRTMGLPLQIRIGLNSGEVVVRSVGSDLRMDYTAVGQTTHLAARMEQLATPGSTLITPDTLRLAEGYVQVSSLGPVAVKGVVDPIEVYEVLGAGPSRTRLQAAAARGLTRFVGRDAELEVLRQTVDRAGAGRGQVAAVVGEPGVGKSRLVLEFTHSHRTQGWLVLAASSVSYGKATAYLPVVDLLEAYFQVDARDDARRIREKVAGKVLMLDESLRSTLPPLLTLFDVPVDDPDWEAVDPQRRRELTLEAMKRVLLRESREQPLLLVFEDLHWVDPETQAFLDSLVEAIPAARMLLLVNYRPEYQNAWSGKTYHRQLRLDPLPPDSADELLDSLVGEDTTLDPMKRLLIGRTEGNPFFLEESVRTLVESGALVGERGRYQLARPLAGVQVPATVQAVLAARVDRLAPEDKQLLQAAAVIGKDFPYALLAAIAEVPEEVARQSLARLQGAEFLYETSLYPDHEYTFKHALTHEVAYGSLLQDRRRRAHARIVEAMEALYRDPVGDQVEQLAQHALRGELWEKSVIYSEMAAQRALNRYAYQDAVRLLEQAIDVRKASAPGDVRKRCDLLLALGEALIPAGEPLRSAGLVASEAFALAEALGDQGRAFRSSHVALRALFGQGQLTAARAPEFQRWAERADQYAAPDTVNRVWADLYLSHVHQAAGRMAEAPAVCRRALELARRVNDPEALFECAGPMLVLHLGRVDELEERLRLAEELLRSPREGIGAASVATMLCMSGSVLLAVGERDRAEDLWHQAEDVAQRTGDPVALSHVLVSGIVRATLDGDLEGAVRAVDHMVAHTRELGIERAGRQNAALCSVRLVAYLGREESADLAQDSFNIAGRRGVRRAFCLAHLGRQEDARAALDEDFRRPGATPEDDAAIRGLAPLLETAVLLENRDLAARTMPRLAGAAHVLVGAYYDSTCVARHLGAAAALLGDYEAAIRYTEQAVAVAGRVRHRPELALSRLQLAELMLDDAHPHPHPHPHPLPEGEGVAQAQTHLDFAIEELRAMKMQPALERALRHKDAPSA